MKMRFLSILFCCLISLLQGWADISQESISAVVSKGLLRAEKQSLRMAKYLENKEGKLPKSVKNEKIETTDYSWWCSGFFPGVLWYLYEANPDQTLRKYAEMYTYRVEKAKNVTYNHDVGFMINCSFGNGYRITGNPKYRDVIVTAAKSLSSRFDTKVGLIRSWDFFKDKWQYPVIIDNMMNLELMTNATRISGNPYYYDIAVSHANKTMQHHFRDDYSCYHVVSYDTISALPHIKQTHQGYSDNSSWARGQAWALYGFTMMYRETGKREYLIHANKVAKYLMNHPAMPSDKVPYWDFDCPISNDTPRDASAAAIMASALLELSLLNSEPFGNECFEFAEKQVRSLTSDKYLAQVGFNNNFILMHSTGHYPAGSEIDVPLSYADYYYVEALVRLKHIIEDKPSGKEDRYLWVKTLTRIADPVVENLANATLKKNMPVSLLEEGRRKFAYLEATGRLLCGMAPWLELGEDQTQEGRLRAKYANLFIKGLRNAVNPNSPDYMDFGTPYQPLVDAAFLAQGLLRSPNCIWSRLDSITKERIITELKRTRKIKPWENNWLLFASIIEATLLEFTGECDVQRLYYGVDKFMDKWYKGDAVYGDGEDFRFDYYNSFVIHPMLTDVLNVICKYDNTKTELLDNQIKRLSGYAGHLERLISPEGTFPVIGRSIVYRTGALHALSLAALIEVLPQEIIPSQVRCAMTAVVSRQFLPSENFQNDGWLSVGFAGKQPTMAEYYINTGSLYLCSTGFLALGLPPSHPFWSGSFSEWTNLRAWTGKGVSCDKAID